MNTFPREIYHLTSCLLLYCHADENAAVKENKKSVILMAHSVIIHQGFLSHFYRAMHFSAFARSCDRMSSVRLSVCPSVRLSVCNVGDL